MTTEMHDQLVMDGMPAPPADEPLEEQQPLATLNVDGPADAAFKTAVWGLEAIRNGLAQARADRARLNQWIAQLVKQERYLTRMARIADEYAQDESTDEVTPPSEE